MTLWAANRLDQPFLRGLYYAPDGTTDQLLFVMLAPRTTLNNGIFVGGTRTAPITPSGGFGMFQVRAWTTAYGASYEAALANQDPCLGKSNIIRVDTGDPTTVPPGTPAALTGLQPFSFGSLSGIPCVPEPGTWTLALLALAACSFRFLGRGARNRQRNG